MIRTLLVDDEAPARDRLRALLAGSCDIEICGEACDGIEALERIEELKPDLVFLDIQMPGKTGLEVVGCMKPPRPHVVFLTAFDEFAVEAFELHAVDYLLKPTGETRLLRALDRVRKDLSQTRDRADAAVVQQQLLSPRTSSGGSLAYSGGYRPARNVGGDYYDFLELASGRVGLALGDVAGKGTYAGILMAALQARLQALAHGRSPQRGCLAEMIGELNRGMFATAGSNRYASLFYAEFDVSSHVLRYVNAGHPAPFLLREASDAFESLPPSGTVVGLLQDPRWVERSTQVDPGDLLVICSDGVTEAQRADGEEFGEPRWQQAIRENRRLPVHELRDVLLNDVAQFIGSAPQYDDVSLIVARVGDRQEASLDG